MKTEIIKRLGKAIIVSSLIMMVVSVLSIIVKTPILDLDQIDLDQITFAAFIIIVCVIYFPLTWMIISHSPHNIIGWLFLVVVVSLSLETFSFAFFEALGIQAPFVQFILPLFGNLWIFALSIPLTLMLLFFPDGQLLSRRWWLVVFAAVLGSLAIYLSFILEEFLPDIANYGWAGMAAGILPPLQLFFLIGMLGAMISVALRYRISKGIIRAQIKWLAYMSALEIVALLISLGTGLVDTPLGLVIFFSPPVVIALAIGMAILRYRLYDIDIIIRRTLSYSILTAILALVYFGGVLLLQFVFGSLFSDSDSPLILVISTLASAALFNPLRARVQAFIDRRFFRSKYDAEKALADFSAVARDEVDMVRLSGSLLSVIETTIQPEKTSLWLRKTMREE
ncbi:MAG: hypothetical protein ACK2UW_12040 [Anaerolineales bacterium]|jgi:hypothetical protein